MSRRLQENIVALAIQAIFIAVLIASAGYGPRARLVPIPIAAIGVLLIVAQLVVQNARSKRDLHVDLLNVIANKPEGWGATSTEPAGDPRRPVREIIGLLTVAGLLGLFIAVGPVVAVFVFVLGYTLFTRQLSTLKCVLIALIFSGAAYAVFAEGLGMRLDRGLIHLGFGLF